MNKLFSFIILPIFLLSFGLTIPSNHQTKFDLPPMLQFFSDTNNTITTAVLTAVATDSGSNAGILWIKIYENGTEIGSKDCQGASSCTFVKTVIKTYPGTYSYYAKTRDKGDNTVQSQTILIKFEGLNHPPQINSYTPQDLTPELNVSDTLHFEVWASDPDNDPLSYSWTLDSQQVSTNSGWDYTPTINNIGTHMVKVIVSDGEYEANQTWQVKVLKIQTTCSLNFNPPSPIYYSQQPFVASCSCTNPEATAELWRDNQNVTEENNQPVTLAAKPSCYSYVCNVSETEHYQSATISSSYVINKAQTILQLTALPSWNVVYGTQTTVSCSANNNEVTLHLYRNSQEVAIPDVALLAAGSYNYVCNATESQNWTAASETNNLIVNKAPSQVNLLLNNQDGNITVAVNQVVEMNGTLLVPSKARSSQDVFNEQVNLKGSNKLQIQLEIEHRRPRLPTQYTIYLWVDGQLVASGEHNLFYTTTFSSPGLHNATLLYLGTQNYSSSSETHWIEVIGDNQAPRVTLVSPPDNSLLTTKNVTVSYSVTDNFDDLLDCKVWSNTSGVWQVDAQQQTANSSTNWLNYTNLANGIYVWNVECIDNAGNSAFAPQNWSFEVFVDEEPPQISNITLTPPIVPQYQPVVIEADVTDNVAVDKVLAIITKPDSSTVIEEMTNISNVRYRTVFTETDIPGPYNLTIWANDTSGLVASVQTSFEVIQALHDVGIANLELAKEVNGSNVSLQDSTAYLYDTIYVNFDLINLGTFNETVNVTLQNNFGMLDSKLIDLRVGEVKLVTFNWNAKPAEWHTLRVKAKPVPGETNFVNNEQSQEVKVWSVCEVVDCSIFGPRTQYDNYSVGQAFLVRAILQNLWNNETFKDFKVELEAPGLEIIGWPALQYYNFSYSEFKVANWNVTSTGPGTFEIKACVGNKEYCKTKQIYVS